MNTITHISYWATPMWYVDLPDLKNQQASFISCIHDLRYKHPSRTKSNRGGWQSPLIKPQSGPLKSLVDEILKISTNLDLNISESALSQMWVNVNKKGDYNFIHQHSSKYDLSSIYYVKTPENCGRLIFRDPRPAAMGVPLLNFNYDKGELQFVNPVEGRLFIFPTFLDHMVEPSESDEERISISADITSTWKSFE